MNPLIAARDRGAPESLGPGPRQPRPLDRLPPQATDRPPPGLRGPRSRRSPRPPAEARASPRAAGPIPPPRSAIRATFELAACQPGRSRSDQDRQRRAAIGHGRAEPLSRHAHRQPGDSPPPLSGPNAGRRPTSARPSGPAARNDGVRERVSRFVEPARRAVPPAQGRPGVEVHRPPPQRPRVGLVRPDRPRPPRAAGHSGMRLSLRHRQRQREPRRPHRDRQPLAQPEGRRPLPRRQDRRRQRLRHRNLPDRRHGREPAHDQADRGHEGPGGLPSRPV